jgi:hypothetical protein
VDILLDTVAASRPAEVAPQVVLPTELVLRESTGPLIAAKNS